MVLAYIGSYWGWFLHKSFPVPHDCALSSCKRHEQELISSLVIREDLTDISSLNDTSEISIQHGVYSGVEKQTLSRKRAFGADEIWLKICDPRRKRCPMR
mmetsp:Transcript_25166/g.57536  ORF Transcript_25166/g.57536 Transcript_25166/m.57536 type:complete len:100 (-) Transcript_25166:570-869(-)